MKNQRLTIETAVKRIDEILDNSEERFHAQYGRYPALTTEEDYFLLADFLNLKEESLRTRFQVKSDYGMVDRYALPPHDLAHREIIRVLRRQGVFQQFGEHGQEMFDGIFGRIDYNVPSREFGFRARILQSLEAKGVKFPTDEVKGVAELLEQIKNASFLNQAYRENRPNYRTVNENTSTFFCNPASMMKVRLEQGGYDALIDWYKRHAEVKPSGKMCYS